MKRLTSSSCASAPRLYSAARGVDRDRRPLAVGRVERHRLEQPLHHGVQAAGADVLGALVDVPGDLGDPADAIGGELDGDALGRAAAPAYWVSASGSREDRSKSLDQRRQLDPDREAALQLRDQVGRLGDVERAAGDEQDGRSSCRTLVLTVEPSTSGSRSRCTPSRETSAPCTLAPAADLVDLVDEDDAVLSAFRTARAGSPPR